MIFESLNKSLVRDNFYDASVWIVSDQVSSLKEAVVGINQGYSAISLESPAKSLSNPPTYFKQNEFLDVFQEIVDTYGVPRYQEINPAIFTTITFPFLFGIMFGDIGHGLALVSFGIYLFIQGKDFLKDFQIYRFRYLVFLMGFFAFYCGLLYNDFIGLSLPLFGNSCYNVFG